MGFLHLLLYMGRKYSFEGKNNISPQPSMMGDIIRELEFKKFMKAITDYVSFNVAFGEILHCKL